MSEFRFADPGWIHALWGVLGFCVLLAVLERRGGGALEQLVGPALQGRLVRGPAGWRRLARVALLAATGLCLVLALMRPQWGMRQVATQRIGAELMIALDVSRSMLAEDTAPSRLERAKAEIVDLLAYLDGDQVGLIAFAGRASVLSPLTPDFGFLRLVLESVGVGSVTRGGTRLEEPIRKALAGFGPPSGASRAILLITDGEDHGSFPLDAAAAAAEAGVTIISIGFGDEAGSEIYATDPRSGARELLRDADGRPVRSRLDGALLREIALATGGAYVPAGTGVLDLESIYDAHIAGLTRGALDPRGRTVRDEAYGWFVLAGLVLLVGSVGIASGPSVLAVLLFASIAVAPGARAEDGPDAGSSDAATDPAETVETGAPPETAPEPQHASPRERYNRGVEALEEGDFDEAERWLARARREAGNDAELRYRASYDLGFVEVQRAGRIEAETPDEALESLHRAADWLHEAVSLRPDAEDARVNLDVAQRRALLLADRLARERRGGIEAELGDLAQRQRGVASDVVRLHALSAADPSPDAGERLRHEYRNVATAERTLLSDADALAARTTEEFDALSARDEAERTPEDDARRAQLAGVLHYLHRARERMGQTRRQLRQREGQRAYRRAAASLREIERAIDQLRDPVRVMDRLLREQTDLALQTAMLVAAERNLAGPDEAGSRPAWLDREAAAAAQASLIERVAELGMRLELGIDSEAAGDPSLQALQAAVAQATPFVQEAHARLREAFTALDGNAVHDAPRSQRAGIRALADARERFLDLRGLIEAAYAEQHRMQEVLHTEDATLLAESLEPLRDAQARNLERSQRLTGRLADEKAAATQAAEAAAGDPSQPAQAAAQERLVLAEQLLPLAIGAMRDAADALGRAGAPARSARFPVAQDAVRGALAQLEILRRIFMSIAELVRDVADRQLALADETRDSSAAAAGAPDAPASDVTPLAEHQTGLAERAFEIADALARQSGEAAGSEDPSAAESADRLRLAGEHVLQAEGAMREADAALRASPAEFETAGTTQQRALAELGEALALLQPPQQGDPQGGDQGEPEPQPGGDDAQQGQGEKGAEPQADPGQLLQGVRDREAQRARERARSAAGADEAVERDW